MPFPLVASLAVGTGIKAASNLWSASQKKKQAKRRKTASTANLNDLLSGYTDKSQAETDYLEILKQRGEEGSLPVRELTQQVSRAAGEQGSVARQAAAGFAASRGLERSGIAASLVGKVDAQTVQTIAKNASIIALQNELTKTEAQDRLGGLGIQESGLEREAARIGFEGREAISGQFYGDQSQARDYTSAAIGNVGDAFLNYGQNQGRADSAGKWVWDPNSGAYVWQD